MGHEYGSGSGRIWLDDVDCTGSEENFTHCRHAGWGIHDCDHSQDVSVSCYYDASRRYAGRTKYCYPVLFFCVRSISGVVAGETGAIAPPLPLNFSVSENLLSKKFLPCVPVTACSR